MSFDKIPVEIQALILSELNPVDLQKTAQVSKILRKERLDLLAAHPGYQEVKNLPNTADYYAVGNKVETSQPSNLWDKGFPYRKERKSIPDNEIKNAIPKSGEIKLFRTQKEAQEYAALTLVENHSKIDRMAAVFRVQLKESVNDAVITKQQITPSLYATYRIGPSQKTVDYVKVDVNNLNFISGQVSHYKEVSLNQNQDKCFVM